MEDYNNKAIMIMNEVNKVVIGKRVIIGKALTAILAKGHILLEDYPGVGKTTLALAFSKSMALKHNRLQFTPEELPTEVVGFPFLRRMVKAISINRVRLCVTCFWPMR